MREPCKYLEICEEEGHPSGWCMTPRMSDKCEYRPDREIARLKHEVWQLKRANNESVFFDDAHEIVR